MTEADTLIPEAPPARPQPDGGRQLPVRAWGIPASALLHVLIILGLVRLAGVQQVLLPPQAGVAVEILSSDQFRAIAGRPTERKAPLPEKAALPSTPLNTGPTADARQRVAIPPAAPEADARAGPAQPAMVHASRLMSEAALADPINHSARKSLKRLFGNERAEQLCNVEAMAQLAAFDVELKPDRLVAYAMAATRLSGSELIADGAAFRSDRRWYHLRYHCELTIERDKVAAFEFLVGEPVREDAWEALNLSVID